MFTCFHFVKKALESYVVHVYSSPTISWKKFFIKIILFWFLFGGVCGYFLSHKNFLETQSYFYVRYLFLVIMFGADVQNLRCNVILRNIKIEYDERVIPLGNYFNLIVGANYFWELIFFIAIAFFVNHISFYIYLFIQFFSLYKLSLMHYNRYKTVYKNHFPKHLKLIIPYLL